MVASRSGGAVVDGNESPARPPGEPVEVRSARGDLAELMDHRPVFRVRLQGYDRLEVDNYTAWAEGELVAARRQVDHLLSRYGECSAQLEISRRLLADAPRGRGAFPVSERVQEMLRLAAEEAAALTEAGEREAERIVAEARTEADARLRKAHQIKEMAVAAADELVEHARRERATAAQAVERAEVEAAEILRRAADERARLADQAERERRRAAADAATHLAAVQAQLADLDRQREHARQVVRDLADRIGNALDAVAGIAPEDLPRTHVIRGNVAVEAGGPEDPGSTTAEIPGARAERDVTESTGRSAPVPH
jgi:cell division septum initiation protein DivIVA